MHQLMSPVWSQSRRNWYKPSLTPATLFYHEGRGNSGIRVAPAESQSPQTGWVNDKSSGSDLLSPRPSVCSSTVCRHDRLYISILTWSQISALNCSCFCRHHFIPSINNHWSWCWVILSIYYMIYHKNTLRHLTVIAPPSSWFDDLILKVETDNHLMKPSENSLLLSDTTGWCLMTEVQEHKYNKLMLLII